MVKTRKVITIQDGLIHYECVRDFRKNIYRIFWIANSWDADGKWRGTQKRTLATANTLAQAMHILAEITDEDMEILAEIGGN